MSSPAQIDQQTVGVQVMPRATLSSKYQIVIPKEIRKEVPLVVGQVLQVIAKNGVITLIPDRPLSALRGFVKGLKTGGFREKEDRL
jgi:AbrB family looped-hinge helix DNA binding protein